MLFKLLFLFIVKKVIDIKYLLLKDLDVRKKLKKLGKFKMLFRFFALFLFGGGISRLCSK